MALNGGLDCSETDPGVLRMRREAARQGVTGADNLPFLLHPPAAKVATLMVHGFTGTPWEMRPLAEEFAANGIATLAVRLPGHGTSPQDLARCRWEDWYQAVREGYLLLDSKFEAIYGIGMSTGCLLLLLLARAHPLRGLVLFSPYLRTLHWLAPYAGWLRWIIPYHLKPGADHGDEHYYSRRPVAGVHQINRLLRRVYRELPTIDCPVLAFNGEGDEIVNIASGRQLVDSLGSSVKIHMRFGPDIPHVLTREENPCLQAMFLQTTHFVQELENPGQGLRVR